MLHRDSGDMNPAPPPPQSIAISIFSFDDSSSIALTGVGNGATGRRDEAGVSMAVREGISVSIYDRKSLKDDSFACFDGEGLVSTGVRV